MDVPQPLLDLGYDPAMTATLFAVFKDTLETSIKQALANSTQANPRSVAQTCAEITTQVD